MVEVANVVAIEAASVVVDEIVELVVEYSPKLSSVVVVA
jgi:hypothetical protein